MLFQLYGNFKRMENRKQESVKTRLTLAGKSNRMALITLAEFITSLISGEQIRRNVGGGGPPTGLVWGIASKISRVQNHING